MSESKEELSLHKLVQDKIKQLGMAEAGKFFADPLSGKTKSVGTMHAWTHSPDRIPAWAAQRAYDDVYTSSLVIPSGDEIPWNGEGVTILWPVYRTTNPRTAFCVTVLMKKYREKVNLFTMEYTGVVHARNTLATKFMKQSKAEWSLWIDDDMLLPIGAPNVYNGKWKANLGSSFASMDIIERLTKHGRDVVSALYSQKETGGRAVYHKALVDDNESSYARNAPKDELRDAGLYVGMGATLIHRRVYEAIEQRFPEVVPNNPSEPYRYFTPTLDQRSISAEDVAFCHRARACGFSLHVDLGCVCGHEGMATYWPHKQ